MSAVTDRFAAMSPGAVSDHFATAATSEIATLVQDSEDGDLRRVLEIDHVRAALLDAILSRFAEFADADRLAVLEGVVRFELVASKKRTEVHTLSFHDGGVARDSRESPQVTITADIVDFVRLATGHANAALLYLGGRLGIEGHDLLALDVGNVFSLPGSDRAAIDPTSLDPVDVATAVATTLLQAHAPRHGGRLPSDPARGGLPTVPRLHRRGFGCGARPLRGLPDRRSQGR